MRTHPLQIALIVFLLVTVLGLAKDAESTECPASPQVCTDVTVPPADPPVTSTTIGEPFVPAEELPVTGSNTAVLVAVGAVFIAFGGVALHAGRS